MVLEIPLSNFFSINEEVLDLRAGKIKTAKSRALSNTIKFDDIEVLKTVALYGANASFRGSRKSHSRDFFPTITFSL